MLLDRGCYVQIPLVKLQQSEHGCMRISGNNSRFRYSNIELAGARSLVELAQLKRLQLFPFPHIFRELKKQQNSQMMKTEKNP